MSIQLFPAKAEHAEKFHRLLGEVANEGRFLMFTKAPPVEVLKENLVKLESAHSPNVFAFDGEKLIGWCDLQLTSRETAKHRAELGMGLLKEYRGKGIGRAMIENVIKEASSFGLEKIDLIVLADNESAIKLYKSIGFKEEGRILKYRKLDYDYTDAIHMGLFL